MRKFSDWEKNIIREIANLGNGNFTFDVFILFSDVFIDEKFFIDSNTFALWYNSAKIKHEDLIAEKHKIYDTVLLLDYLEQNRYIFLHGMGNKDYGKSHNYYINTELNDWMAKKLYACISSELYVSQDLYSLVENNFKEYDELVLEEAKMQTKSAKLSVWFSAVAVIIAFASLFVGIFCSFAD